MPFSAKPLISRVPGRPPRVIILGRISTPHQNIENIDASYRYVEKYLKQICACDPEILHLGERASGLIADRETILRAAEEVESGGWDLVIAEDLSRIYRNPRYQWAFVQDAVDQGTRVICIADNIDTADDHWELAMHAAAIRHGCVIPDTRRRVRRTADNSFHNGGMVQKIRFGYRKLSQEEAQSGKFGPIGLRIAKVPEHTAIIKAIRDKVLSGQSYNAIADWLNELGVPVGPYATSNRWTGKLVIDFLRDPILHGTRTFRDTVCQPIFRSGKYKRCKNTGEPETETYPELAHLTPEVHEELIAEMDRRKDEHSHGKCGKDHPMHNRPRSRTLWPGQHMRCAICSGLYYWYDNSLKCENSFERGDKHCWNHVQISAEEVREKVLGWILEQFNEHKGFREALVESAWQEYVREFHSSKTKMQSRDDEILELEKQSANLAKAIKTGGKFEALLEELRIVDQSLQSARRKQEQERQRRSDQPTTPFGSKADFESRLHEGLLSLANTSFDFGDLMRLIVPQILVCPVQALDTGLVRPRLKITLKLTNILCADEIPTSVMGELHTTLDAFEYPIYVKHLQACLDLTQRDPKISQIEISRRLGVQYMTVKRAFAYYRLMQADGLSNPYRELTSPPKNASRWKIRGIADNSI